MQGTEQCDDGNTSNTDACTNACKTATCGDGFVRQGTEQCDDGNTVNTDACTNACMTARCGDGFVQGTEQCDDGNMVNTDTCTTTCQTARCGDGFLQGTEQCDDGNTSNTDACTNACKTAACGDGFIQGTEQCDDGNTVNTDACSNACKSASCGDGIPQAGEECDDGNTVNTDTCTNACKKAACGDGFVQGTEQCDDGNTSNTDTCTNACKKAVCGDGFTQGTEECDDGNTNNGDSCMNSCKKHYNIAFVSSTTYTVATLGGVAGADAKCQSLAAAAGIATGATYVAWVSDSHGSIASRLGAARGWVRPDGKPFLDDYTTDTVFYPPEVTEKGVHVTPTDFAMGGYATSADPTCDDWNANSTALSALGDPTEGSGGWNGTWRTSVCMGATFRIYCLGKDFTNTMTFPKATGRLAFVSSAWTVSGGIASADVQCQNDATAAGLQSPSTFRALMATSTASMASRFNASGAPWVRVDGIPVVTAASDLLTPGGKMLAALNVQANGTYLTNYAGWTGSGDPTLPSTAANTCNNWTSAASTSSAISGRVLFSTVKDAFGFDVVNRCDSMYEVYCLQQ